MQSFQPCGLLKIKLVMLRKMPWLVQLHQNKVCILQVLTFSPVYKTAITLIKINFEYNIDVGLSIFMNDNKTILASTGIVGGFVTTRRHLLSLPGCGREVNCFSNNKHSPLLSRLRITLETLVIYLLTSLVYLPFQRKTKHRDSSRFIAKPKRKKSKIY